MRYLYYLAAFILIGCGTTKKEKKVYSNPQSIDKELVEKAGPTYTTYYTPDKVELDKIILEDEVDPYTAVMLLTNSCKEIKADYLNYMMEVYATDNPDESEVEPMFDAEHIGQFIVWQYVNKDTECLVDIFKALNQVFNKGTEETIALGKYAIFEMIIMESRKLDVNYNTAYSPFFSGSVGKRFMDYLWHEKESGRS